MKNLIFRIHGPCLYKPEKGNELKILPIILSFALFIGISAQALAEPKTLLVYGDSLVAGYGLEANQSFPAQLQQKLTQKGIDVAVIAAGVSGETTAGALTRLAPTLTQYYPTHAIVITGGNDMLRRVDMKQTAKNLNKIAETFDQDGIPLLLAGMKSFRTISLFGNDFQDMYEDAADEYHAHFYPFFLEGVAMKGYLNLADGIHPNAQGVALIVDNILPDVEKLLEQSKTPKAAK